jgi:hypothetical protein
MLQILSRFEGSLAFRRLVHDGRLLDIAQDF